MPKFILSWWGDYTDSKKIDTIYKSFLLWKRILYIPRAMYPNKYPDCIEWIVNTFPSSEWYSVYVLSEKEFIESQKDYLNSFDWIYIWWWNTFRLLKLIKETWFNKIIKQFMDNNKPIYWWSAWAIIMGKEISTAGDRNAVKLDDKLWFNICDNYSIFCHYESKKDNEIVDYIKNYKIPVICLPEGTGIVFDGTKYSIQWNESAYMFSLEGEKKELVIWSIL